MPMFDKNYIKNELEKINKQVSNKINIYIFGGAAMSYFDLKAATKDIDVLLTSETEIIQLTQALLQIGYQRQKDKDPIYLKMKTRDIIENEDGFRWDIFINKVCGGLTFSEGIKKRSVPFEKFSNINTFLLSPEDLFIFKAVTSRPRDREDMFSLFSHGLDTDIIKNELQNQAKLDESKAWLSYFFVGLNELVTKFHIIFPGFDTYRLLAENEMIEKIILDLIQRKPQSLDNLESKVKIEKEEIKTFIKKLIDADKIILSNGKYHIKK
ncbi:MAG: hypothetical protein KGY65_08550 [Candidatus Thermoplasmatota archaeon]|nr:hypothetical protein [Candidatus Thermoplasmatota archaeon]MBS3802782.1 hypothetical protein [Candidatus Thermoplasmatota archaeon]